MGYRQEKIMNTLLEIQPIAAPFAVDVNGVVKISGSRVTLDTVVRAFLRGATAEEIAQQYPSISLADVYATISYYLQHRAEVEKYLEKRRRSARTVREQNQKRFDQSGIRERLLARKK
jgi:uncharacterized protein (DUF433 family)